MSNSQGIDKNQDRVQTAHKTSPDRSASHEATRDPKLNDRPQPCELTTHVSLRRNRSCDPRNRRPRLLRVPVHRRRDALKMGRAFCRLNSIHVYESDAHAQSFFRVSVITCQRWNRITREKVAIRMSLSDGAGECR
jgi:hypothetical protein